MVIAAHRVMVLELGEDKAEAQLLARQGPVVVVTVVLLVAQGEGLGQRLQLGGDVGLGDVLHLSPAPVHTGVDARLQELHGEGWGRTWDSRNVMTTTSPTITLIVFTAYSHILRKRLEHYVLVKECSNMD